MVRFLGFHILVNHKNIPLFSKIASTSSWKRTLFKKKSRTFVFRTYFQNAPFFCEIGNDHAYTLVSKSDATGGCQWNWSIHWMSSVFCRPTTKGHNWQFCQNWVITITRSRVTISISRNHKTPYFRLINPKNISSKNEFYVQVNGSQAQLFAIISK